jgi:hypothetical protein
VAQAVGLQLAVTWRVVSSPFELNLLVKRWRQRVACWVACAYLARLGAASWYGEQILRILLLVLRKPLLGPELARSWPGVGLAAVRRPGLPNLAWCAPLPAVDEVPQYSATRLM